MDQERLQQLAADSASAAAAAWGATAPPRLIRAVENAVYEIACADGPIILRLTSSAHRTQAQVEAELAWIERLAAHGLDVARPIRSSAGALCERISAADGSWFITSAFAKAPGEALRPGGARWNPASFTAWGRLFGAMHRLSPSTGGDLGIHRPAWEDEEVMARRAELLGPGPELDRLESEVAWLRSLPAAADGFGLIHADLSHGNLFAHDGGVTAFDFDDCCRHWHAYDLAVAIHLVLSRLPAAELRAFLAPFLTGYRLEKPLAPEWLELLPRFLRLRDLLLLAWCRMKWPGESGRQVPYARGIAANVADPTRYRDLDFSGFSA